MKEIKWAAEKIRDELEDAENYAKKALSWRDSSPELSQLAAGLAQQELTHVDMLHKQAVKLIEAQRQKGVAVPPAMQAVWDWEHEHMVARTIKVKALLDEVRKG